MAANPAFISTARVATVNVATANTAIDGTGTITSLITGVAAGTRVLEIDVQCAATSAAANVNIFLSTDSGTTWRLFDQIAVTAATASNTVKANRNVTSYTNLVLPSTSAVLGVATSISQSTNVIALGGDLT
jgi:hypothetical protein